MRNQNQVYYKNPYCILFVNQKGLLRTLYTPFKVRPVSNVEGYKNNSVLWVTEVLEDASDRFVYKINDKLYPYWYFSVIAFF